MKLLTEDEIHALENEGFTVDLSRSDENGVLIFYGKLRFRVFAGGNFISYGVVHLNQLADICKILERLLTK